MKKVIILATFLLPLSSAMALDCTHATTQTDMSLCARESYKNSDEAMNKVYQEILRKIEGEQKKLLKISQKNWIKYRDYDCDFRTSISKDGSINPMLKAQCLEEITTERKKQLDKMLNCEEGDLTCAL